MSWGRINHPTEIVKVGDEIEVIVLKFDKPNARISLGLKQKTKNPWETVEEIYPIGKKIVGKVVNIMPYGAFIELEEGIEGLIHISEFSWTKRISHPSEVISVGDEVEAMVLSIEKEKEKISLGIKQTEFNPWSVVEEKYPAGKRITGTIRNITSYGAFIELEEGIDGLIHISDISWTKKINNPAEVLKKGEQIEAVILSVDQENKKIALGIKQLSPDPWENLEDKYAIGQSVTGTVTKITGFGVFVTLDSDIEGLIHASQISDKPFTKLEDIVTVGDEITANIVKIDTIDRKIALSVKEFHQAQKQEEVVQKKTKEKVAVKEFKSRKKRENSFESTSILSEQLDELLFSKTTETPEKPKKETPAQTAGETETEEISSETPAQTADETEIEDNQKAEDSKKEEPVSEKNNNDDTPEKNETETEKK